MNHLVVFVRGRLRIVNQLLKYVKQTQNPQHSQQRVERAYFPFFGLFDGGEGHAGLLGETQLRDVLPQSCLFQTFSNLELDYHVGKHVYVIHNGLILNFNAAKIQIKVEFATVVERISQLAQAVALALEKVVRCCLKGWKKLYLCGLYTGKKVAIGVCPLTP